jgi:ankyrin repeat protein
MGRRLGVQRYQNKKTDKGKVRRFFANNKIELAASAALLTIGIGIGALYGKYSSHPKEQVQKTLKQEPMAENKIQNKAAEKNVPEKEITEEERKLNEQLLEAVMKEDIEEAKRLLDNGAKPNGKNSTGCPFLTWAAWNDDRDMVILLIERDVDVNAEDPFGYSALGIAETFGKKEMIELLKDHGAE